MQQTLHEIRVAEGIKVANKVPFKIILDYPGVITRAHVKDGGREWCQSDGT